MTQTTLPNSLAISEHPHRLIAKRVFKTEETTSTNEIMLKDPNKIFQSGDVLWSLKQNEGRGRYQRTWISNKGGLYFSLLFEDITSLTAFFPFILLIALAIRNNLAEKTHDDFFTIKWPNDIYADHHKIGGILVQSQTILNKTRAVAGVGININNTIQSVRNLRNPAVSLYELTGDETDLNVFFKALLDKTDEYYRDFIHGKFPEYLPILNQHLYSRNEPTIFSIGNSQRIVTPKEFTKDGHIVCDEGGESAIFVMGEFI
jgi:BirA family biotin operon repressor/biotin-[acetyl-CoA-carboxylase] ligase